MLNDHDRRAEALEACKLCRCDDREDGAEDKGGRGDMGEIGETGDPGGGVELLAAPKKAWLELLLDRFDDGGEDSVADEGKDDVAEENEGRLFKFLEYDSPVAISCSSPSAYVRGGAAAVGSDEGVVTILGILTDMRERGWLAVAAESRTTAVVESLCMLPVDVSFSAVVVGSLRVFKATICLPVGEPAC